MNVIQGNISAVFLVVFLLNFFVTASAQSPAPEPEPTSATAPIPAPTNDNATTTADARKEQVLGAVSGNPAADNILPGTGFIGQALGFEKNSGLRFGGLWLGDTNDLLSGGQNPGTWSFNSMLVLGVNACKCQLTVSVII